MAPSPGLCQSPTSAILDESTPLQPSARQPSPPPIALILVAFGLFLVWSNSFVAIEFLLEGEAPRFHWMSLTVARFLPAAVVGGIYLALRRRHEAVAVIRAQPLRLLACGALMVPLYNFALGFGQQQGVPASVASLTTTLAPLFVMVLAGVFLGERATRRTISGLAIAAAGMAIIATSRESGADVDYSWAVLVTAGAPMSWACYSVLSKPVAGRASPVVWSYLTTGVGGLLVLPLLPGAVWRRWCELDGAGWVALLYLSLPCTVLGFALWTWLLRHLPATAVGLLVFLNPPLTTVSKWTLARWAPATFQFGITAGEWVGGAVVLAGLALALSRRLLARSS